jgi:hypothetical protein
MQNERDHGRRKKESAHSKILPNFAIVDSVDRPVAARNPWFSYFDQIPLAIRLKEHLSLEVRVCHVVTKESMGIFQQRFYVCRIRMDLRKMAFLRLMSLGRIPVEHPIEKCNIYIHHSSVQISPDTKPSSYSGRFPCMNTIQMLRVTFVAMNKMMNNVLSF